jgi:hypothetical protein
MSINYFHVSKLVPELNNHNYTKNIFPYIYHKICGDLFIEKNNT